MTAPDPAPQLLARLLADQRDRWGRGQRIRVETYLRQHSALEADPEAVLDLIYNEVFLREQAGETPRLDEYLDRFPLLAGPLRMQFAVHQAIQTEAPPRAAGKLPEVPGYEILGEIGRGGMGVVYQAHDRQLDRMVAVKMLRSKHAQAEGVRKRFLTEVRAVAVLDHPNLVKVHTAGECALGPYLVMELLAGPSLETVLAPGPLDVARAVDLVIPVAEAVHYAHSRGVIHRDLKPANIMLDEAGRPRVMDFGLAKVFGNTPTGLSSTQQGMILGTPSYMPPEQAGQSQVKPGPYNDVYSLGAILYALLTGRPPFAEKMLVATLLKVRSDEPPAGVRSLRPEVSRRLERICLQCLSKDHTARPVSALVLADELRNCAAERSAEQTRPAATAKESIAPTVPVLAVLRSVSTGESIPLTQETTILGRSAECDIVVKGPEVSRRHCRILCSPDEVIVEDLGSVQGTCVNASAVTRARLQDGDRLRIGKEVFQFRLQRSGGT